MNKAAAASTDKESCGMPPPESCDSQNQQLPSPSFGARHLSSNSSDSGCDASEGSVVDTGAGGARNVASLVLVCDADIMVLAQNAPPNIGQQSLTSPDDRMQEQHASSAISTSDGGDAVTINSVVGSEEAVDSRRRGKRAKTSDSIAAGGPKRKSARLDCSAAAVAKQPVAPVVDDAEKFKLYFKVQHHLTIPVQQPDDVDADDYKFPEVDDSNKILTLFKSVMPLHEEEAFKLHMRRTIRFIRPANSKRYARKRKWQLIRRERRCAAVAAALELQEQREQPVQDENGQTSSPAAAAASADDAEPAAMEVTEGSADPIEIDQNDDCAATNDTVC